MNDILRPYYNIPLELRELKQFCLWRYEDIGASKPTKVPYSTNGQMANVVDPTTWCSFDEAIQHRFNYSGIGFVFSEHDPYTFLDLDDTSGDALAMERQLRIFKEFDSYSEISPSGQGLHIIVKGRVPQGRRRSKIEVYSQARYATMTGNIYHNAPIRERQDQLDMLFRQMGEGGPSTNAYNGNEPEKESDAQIVEKATQAINGDKFFQLYKGHWQDLYPTQSEADLALINMFAFYTQNKIQITRLFRQSPLGARPKAKRNDYIDYMVMKSFDQMLPQIDIDGFKIAVEAIKAGSVSGKPLLFESSIAGSIPAPATNLPTDSSIQLPPGLVGEVAQFIYDSSPRQIMELSIAAALSIMAGICGKAYNTPTGTGLNNYIICVASTGSGKESLASGISKLINASAIQVPTITRAIGPGMIASGQALVKYINKNPCFLSILGEFGIRLKAMSDPNANSAQQSLLWTLLDIYTKSGHHQTFQPSIYADKEKDIASTHAPAFSILAETTPSTFYSALNEDMISAGLLPRFLIIEYKGKVPYLNEKGADVEPNFQLVGKFTTLAAQCEVIMHSKGVIRVRYAEDAYALLKDFGNGSTDKVNANDKEEIKNLWTRAHLKAIKIASLLAVGENYIEPTISLANAQWAINLVSNDIRLLYSKIEQGEIGANTSEIKQLDMMKRMIGDYYTDEDVVKKYRIPQKLYDDKILVGHYLSRRLAAQSPFKNDRQGSTVAIKRCIQTLLDSDTLREMGRQQLSDKYGTTQKCYVLKDLSLIRG